MIPFIDLQTQQEKIKPELDRRLAQVLAHGKYILGPEVQELEAKLADYVGWSTLGEYQVATDVDNA